jgi:hypothetical protein
VEHIFSIAKVNNIVVIFSLKLILLLHYLLLNVTIIINICTGTNNAIKLFIKRQNRRPHLLPHELLFFCWCRRHETAKGGIWNAFLNAIKVVQDAEEGDEKVTKLESNFSTLGL